MHYPSIKKWLWFIPILVLMALAPAVLSCSQGQSTITVTAPASTVTVTTTRTLNGATTTQTPEDAPLTPHSLNLELGACFWCHPIPPGHEGRSMIQDLCAECHREAPISEWKVQSWY